MSCIVLYIEFADKNISEELRDFIDGTAQGYSFSPPKNTNPQSNHLGVQETCAELCRTADVWITVSFLKFFLGNVEVNILQKIEKNRKMQESWQFNV